jgi:multidrug efflux pump subunit AcrB
MFSAIFVDRPRLAVVIAIVISIAGALALLTIPVAQYPDIVPPQVSVTTTYPGASADVVESTVAQPIESQSSGSLARAIWTRLLTLTALMSGSVPSSNEPVSV